MVCIYHNIILNDNIILQTLKPKEFINNPLLGIVAERFMQVEPAMIYSDEVEPRLNLRNHGPLFVRGFTSYVLFSQVLPALVET